jgi:hypothetical protein
MLGQQIPAEIAAEIAPDRVYVIRVVLRVVVFDQERRALYPVVMGRASLLAARPGKVQAAAGFAILLFPRRRDVLGKIANERTP